MFYRYDFSETDDLLVNAVVISESIMIILEMMAAAHLVHTQSFPSMDNRLIRWKQVSDQPDLERSQRTDDEVERQYILSQSFRRALNSL